MNCKITDAAITAWQKLAAFPRFRDRNTNRRNEKLEAARNTATNDLRIICDKAIPIEGLCGFGNYTSTGVRADGSSIMLVLLVQDDRLVQISEDVENRGHKIVHAKQESLTQAAWARDEARKAAEWLAEQMAATIIANVDEKTLVEIYQMLRRAHRHA